MENGTTIDIIQMKHLSTVANNIKSLTHSCIYLNNYERDSTHKTEIKLIQLQIETVTPSDWALGPQKHCC
jgi:hypothetical protein